MRFHFLFLIPYVVLLVVIVVSVAMLQRDQEAIRDVNHRQAAAEHRLCEVQRQSYAVIARGMRKRGELAAALKYPRYGAELRVEADEIERISRELQSCPPASIPTP